MSKNPHAAYQRAIKAQERETRKALQAKAPTPATKKQDATIGAKP